MIVKKTSLLLLACTLLLLSSLLWLPVPVANASSNGIVISQVYGGGGNAGSTFKNDFIEVQTRSAMKNRALCLERLGRPDAALDVLEALPGRFPDFTSAERHDYEQKLAELGSRVGYIEVRGEPGVWDLARENEHVADSLRRREPRSRPAERSTPRPG